MAVRREKVLLEVESNLAPVVLRDAAAVAVLNKELNSLSGQSVRTARASQNISRDTDAIGRSATRADSSINQLTGRLRLFADLAAILGPALLPIGAVAIPAVAGLANQLGVAALAGGTMIVAFQGVGDALKTVNDAVLDPTTENLEKAREALENIGPAAREFVIRMQELRPVLDELRDSAAEGLFPGLVEGIDALERRVPDIERILLNVSTTLGDIFADAGNSLASDRWDDFFGFLATDATQTLSSLGRTVGDLTHGMAELWMAFDPLTDDFSQWLEGVARGFDGWAEGLDRTEGFQEFIDYVRTTGPQVADTFGAMANAVVQIAQAAAPLGGPVLKGLEALANVVAGIADSNLGGPILTAVAALALLNRGMKVYEGLSGAIGRGQTRFLGVADSLGTVTSAQDRARMSAAELDAQAKRTRGSLSLMGAGLGIAAALEGINLLDMAMDDLFDSDFESSNLNRSLEALAAGSVTGAIADTWDQDLSKFNHDLDILDSNLDKVIAFPDKFFPGSLSPLEGARDRIQQIDEALAGMVESGDATGAAEIFDMLAAKAEEGGNSVDQVRGAFQQYGIAVDNAGKRTNFFGTTATGLLGVLPGVEGSTKGTRAAMRELGLQVGPTAERLKVLQEALEKDREAASDTAHEFFNLGNGLDDAKVSLQQWLRSLEKQADALRNFRLNAQQAAKRGLDEGLIASLEQAGAAGALRMRQLANATDTEIERANGAWRRGQREIDRYVDATVDVPKALATDLAVDGVPQAHDDLDGVKRSMAVTNALKATPSVDVNGSAAFAAIEGVKAALRNIPDEHVNVIVNRIGGVTSSYGGQSSDELARGANGMTVPGPRYPYGDKVLSYLAPTEEVISNEHGQADRWRPLLKAINANTLADGGTVRSGGTQPVHVTTSTGPLTATTTLSDRDVERIAAAVRAGAREGIAKSEERQLQRLVAEGWNG